MVKWSEANMELSVSIIALMFSIWSVINIIVIYKMLDCVLDSLKLDNINNALKEGKELTPEQQADLDRIRNKVRKERKCRRR